MKKAWAFYSILVVILAIPVGFSWGQQITGSLNDWLDFFAENIEVVEFKEGEIVNMPISHQELYFKDWTFHVDRNYTDYESIVNEISEDQRPLVFIGPRQAHIITYNEPRTINYPPTFTDTIDAAYFSDSKSFYPIVIYGGGLLAAFIYIYIVGLLYVFVIITPIVLFKFRRMRLKFAGGLKAALYLASFQVLAFSVLLFLSANIPWSFLFFIAFYILYIGGFVNIDLSGYQSQTESRGRIS